MPDPWSFYISLMIFIGVSPVGALESSPWRKPWEQMRTARSPVGRKSQFTSSDRSPDTKRILTPLRGLRVSGPVPQGLRPGLLSSAPDGAWDRASTRLTRRDELGIDAQTRAENVETPGSGGPDPYSHSMVPGGLCVKSRNTPAMPSCWNNSAHIS